MQYEINQSDTIFYNSSRKKGIENSVQIFRRVHFLLPTSAGSSVVLKFRIFDFSFVEYATHIHTKKKYTCVVTSGKLP